MRKFFKAIQVGLMATAGVVLTQPEALAPFIPQNQQAKVAAIATIAAALLPSMAPRAARRMWGGGMGGDTSNTTTTGSTTTTTTKSKEY